MGKQKDMGYYIKAVIGLVLMVGFQFLPAPEPITKAGMAMIGCLLGMVYLIATVDMVWPFFIAIAMFGFYGKEIYPQSTQDASIYEGAVQSFGNWVILFIIAMMLFCHALNEVGVLRRISIWFMTRKIARRGPWAFTIMFLLSAMVVGAFMDPVPAAMVMVVVADEIFGRLAFKPGDSWPRMVIACIPYTITLSFAMSPIGHNLPIAILGMVSSSTGVPIDVITFLGVGVPVGLLIWVFMLAYFRFIVKPDVSKFNDIDYSMVEDMRPGKMEKREKLVVLISVFVLVFWIIPGVLSVFAPDLQITKILNSLTLLFPIVVGVALMAIIRPDGKPLLDIPEAAKSISWTVVFLNAGILLPAMALAQDTTGIPAWIVSNLGPAVEGFSPFATIALITILCVVLTNLLNNWAVGVMFSAISAPIMIAMGINPALAAVGIAFGVNCAFTTPAASTVTTFAVSDPHCDGSYVLKHGLVMTGISVIVAGLLMYPLGALFYGP